MTHPPNFVCQKCGAALAVPPDPTAVAAHCMYCNTDTVLPQELLHARKAQYQSPYGSPIVFQPITSTNPLTDSKSGGRALWIVLITTLLPLIMAGGIAWFVNSTINSTMKSVTMPHHRGR